MAEKKQHRMLINFIRKEPTGHGAVPIQETIKFTNGLSKFAKKNGYEAYIKGTKKEVIDYKPTGQEYMIKTVEDISDLAEDQIEMFVEDLKNWCKLHRDAKAISAVAGVEISSPKGMIWLDTGKNEEIVKIQTTITNKL